MISFRRARQLRRAPWALGILLALVSVLSLGTAVASASTQWPKISSSSSDYPQRVDFVTVCTAFKNANDDPIVYPGQPGASHLHTFSGGLAINASQTAAGLMSGGTNCTLTTDHSSYWMPALYSSGKLVMPYTTRIYYRADTRTGAKIEPIPFGLKMIAGDAMATKPQDARVAGFQCRIEDKGAVVDKQSLPPACPTGSFLEASVVFPNCWDGVHLDSADHRSHMAYADKSYQCDSAHPVQIPQVTIAERFPIGSTTGTITLASMNSPLTLHADFFDAWDSSVMQSLVTRCINASIACADVSDRRFPPIPS